MLGNIEIIANKGDSKSSETGIIAENDVYDLVKGFKSVRHALFCRRISAFDILLVLAGETVWRGIQVKFMIPRSDNLNQFDIAKINDYPIGTVMVGVNKSRNLGMAYLYSEEYKSSYDGARVTNVADTTSIFSKQLKKWDDFAVHLESLLPKSLIITEEIYISTISHGNLLESYMKDRLYLLCQKLGFKYQELRNNTSATDVVINGENVQLKYLEFIPELNAYQFHVYRSGCIPYSQNQNQWYIFQIGNARTAFLWVSELLLIQMGVIKTPTQDGKITITIFPFGYVNNHNPNSTDVKWSEDKLLWITLEDGWLFNPGFDNIESKMKEFRKLQNFQDDEKILTRVLNVYYDRPYEKKMEAIDRFVDFSECRGWKCEIRKTDKSHPDIHLNGVKIRLSYAQNPVSPSLGHHGFRFSLKINGEILRSGVYVVFVFEIGEKMGEFCIIPEIDMITHGHLQHENSAGKSFIDIYPYDFLLGGGKRKGNWTCDKKYWWTRRGCLVNL